MKLKNILIIGVSVFMLLMMTTPLTSNATSYHHYRHSSHSDGEDLISLCILLIVIIGYLVVNRYYFRRAKKNLKRCQTCENKAGSYKICENKQCGYFVLYNDTFPKVIPCQVCDDFNDRKICRECPNKTYLQVLDQSKLVIRKQSLMFGYFFVLDLINKKRQYRPRSQTRHRHKHEKTQTTTDLFSRLTNQPSPPNQQKHKKQPNNP